MNTTFEVRLADGERTPPATAPGEAATHAGPTHDQRSQRRVSDDRGKKTTGSGRPIECPGLEDRLLEERLHDALAALAHATRVATLDKLAVSIAHEITQPLAAIIMNAGACTSWLDREVPDLQEVKSAARLIVADARRAAEMVRLLGALSRKANPEYRLLNVNDLVTETIPLLRSEVAGHGATLHLDLGSDIPPVAGDKVQLQQVIINLVVNGIQAMASIVGREKSLTIRSRRHRGNRVLVSVIDSGTGINPEHLDTLFDPFFTTKPAGMGMGLPICRSIIDALGGEIGASNNQDCGATFNFALPEFSGGCDRG